MARNWYGEKRIVKEDRYTKRSSTNADSEIRWEIFKMIIWIVFGYAFFHFIVMGWTL